MSSNSSNSSNCLSTYSFGVSRSLVWLVHILLGLFFIYLGVMINKGKQLPKSYGVVLIVLGALAALYHSHLWYVNYMNTNKNSYNKV